MQIKIVNRRKNKDDGVYVGRPTPLGNPWKHGESLTREQAIANYKNWLNVQWTAGNPKVINELNRLADMLEKDGELTLACWCAPKSCHAEVIGKAVQNIIKKRKS